MQSSPSPCSPQPSVTHRPPSVTWQCSPPDLTSNSATGAGVGAAVRGRRAVQQMVQPLLWVLLSLYHVKVSAASTATLLGDWHSPNWTSPMVR